MRPHISCHMITSLDGGVHPGCWTASPDGFATGLVDDVSLLVAPAIDARKGSDRVSEYGYDRPGGTTRTEVYWR